MNLERKEEIEKESRKIQTQTTQKQNQIQKQNESKNNRICINQAVPDNAVSDDAFSDNATTIDTTTDSIINVVKEDDERNDQNYEGINEEEEEANTAACMPSLSFEQMEQKEGGKIVDDEKKVLLELDTKSNFSFSSSEDAPDKLLKVNVSLENAFEIESEEYKKDFVKQ